jgi:GrpB-like predicted nucleotidyltransferase (UPF0157 family)
MRVPPRRHVIPNINTGRSVLPRISMEKSLQQRIDEAVRESISIVPYDPRWPALFEAEADFLRRILPQRLLRRIEHFGSTAVPALAAKPIIDLLIEITSLEETKEHIAPVLVSLGYDYFWRTDVQPPYAWFIKRDSEQRRTHHLHFVEADSALWERLLFRDYLRRFPEEARRYAELKVSLANEFPNDRVAYAQGKTGFIVAVTEKAGRFFGKAGL